VIAISAWLLAALVVWIGLQWAWLIWLGWRVGELEHWLTPLRREHARALRERQEREAYRSRHTTRRSRRRAS
jgi:hypothetical protein